MKAYKLKEAYQRLKSGRLFYEIGTEVLLIATPTEKQEFFYTNTFSSLKTQNLLQEVELLDEKWIHPHLYKPIKIEVNNQISLQQ